MQRTDPPLRRGPCRTPNHGQALKMGPPTHGGYCAGAEPGRWRSHGSISRTRNGTRLNHLGSSFQGHPSQSPSRREINIRPLATYSSGPPKRLRRSTRLAHDDVNTAPDWLGAI
jgi:hypothetical protein